MSKHIAVCSLSVDESVHNHNRNMSGRGTRKVKFLGVCRVWLHYNLKETTLTLQPPSESQPAGQSLCLQSVLASPFREQACRSQVGR